MKETLINKYGTTLTPEDKLQLDRWVEAAEKTYHHNFEYHNGTALDDFVFGFIACAKIEKPIVDMYWQLYQDRCEGALTEVSHLKSAEMTINQLHLTINQQTKEIEGLKNTNKLLIKAYKALEEKLNG